MVAARNLFVQALRSLKRQRDAYSIASVRVNLGRCEADLGRIEEGRMLLMGARQAFQQLKAPSEVARAKAGEARILALQLQDPGGIQELYAVRNTFDALGMPNESALVALDITEALLLSADPR